MKSYGFGKKPYAPTPHPTYQRTLHSWLWQMGYMPLDAHHGKATMALYIMHMNPPLTDYKISYSLVHWGIALHTICTLPSITSMHIPSWPLMIIVLTAAIVSLCFLIHHVDALCYWKVGLSAIWLWKPVGFVKFSEFLVVAKVGYHLLMLYLWLIPCVDNPARWSLELQGSLESWWKAFCSWPVPSMCPDTHIHHFFSLSFPSQQFFDRPILSSNWVPNPSSYTWPCQKLWHHSGARSSDPTLMEQILVYWWRMSTGMVMDTLVLRKWWGLMESHWLTLYQMRRTQWFLEGRSCKLRWCIMILYWIICCKILVHWLHSWQAFKKKWKILIRSW